MQSLSQVNPSILAPLLPDTDSQKPESKKKDCEKKPG